MKQRIQLLLFSLIFLFSNMLQAQEVQKIEPPFWWTGMANSELQILLYGENISHLQPSLSYKGVRLKQTISLESSNYLFVYLDIASNAPAGTLNIDLKDANGSVVKQIPYPLLAREKGAAQRKGYDNSDVLYLITPDRFANGDTSNDEIDGLLEGHNRVDKWGRHGGDVRGIIKHLDYLNDIGYTSIWLNPILENDQDQWSYHGYSTTDYYKVDPRFGSNEEYKELCEVAESKGMKIIMDMIVNHCGSGHWWMEDLPSQDWINNKGEYRQTNHRRTTHRDPYVSSYDKKEFTDGWFVPTMPDLNQRNPQMATYLIQNTIWWIEYLGISGIRMDTYPYSDKDFMTDWTCAVMDEFPNFNICGEEWSLNPAVLAYWQGGKKNDDGYTSCLPGLLDFPIQNALKEALIRPENWNAGMINLYDALSDDFQYADPSKHVIFPDNHDMSRIFTQLGEDVDLFRLAMVYFATMRGTPQFYYGTEILMSNTGDDSHGNIRSDYPGGWPGDSINAFTNIGLSAEQVSAREFVKKLLNWRKTATSIHTGKLMHFLPTKGVYTYFRYDDQQKIMVVLNKTKEQRKIGLLQFEELLPANSSGINILKNQAIIFSDSLTIDPKEPLVIEIK